MLMTILHISISALILAIGMTATGEDIVYLWRRPKLLFKSIFTMYLLIPAIAASMALILDLPQRTGLALVILAICAGAPLLPKKLIKLGGNPAYIFSLIVTTSLLAIVTVPVSLHILAAVIPFDATAVTPMGVAMVILKSFLVPLSAGMLLRRVMPTLADRICDPLLKISGTAMTLCALIALIGGYKLLASIGMETIVAFGLFTLGAILAGHLLGGPEWPDRASLAIACSSRHIGLALLIAANTKGPQTLNLVIAYLLASAVVSALYIAWIKRRVQPVTELTQ